MTGLSAALIVTGCAGGQDSETPGSIETSLLPPAEGHVEYPLALASPYGETMLEERPQRIAAIVPNALDTELLLSLGVTPVLSSSMVNESASGSYLKSYDAASIETFEFPMGATLPIEAIAASDPDLIVAVGWQSGNGSTDLGDSFDKLASIAPVLTSPEQPEGRFLTPWQESIQILGDTLDLSDAAATVIADNDAYFAAFRDNHPEFNGKTATWAIWYDSSYGLHYLSQPDSAPEEFLTGLGFAKNPLAENFAAGTAVSGELLAKIDADVLLLGQSRVADEAEFTEFTNGALFQNLDAVTSGNWIAVPSVLDDGGDILWAVTSGGPIGTEWAAEQLAPRLLGMR
ncbi:ABC transporter substrate-binding protein [Kocuria polaris]|nr:ABC transporter substrate-binding protein [Kocuria polaris]